jgi:proline dehydrogenase
LNVGAILDYAAEADLDMDSAALIPDEHSRYDKAKDLECEANVATFTSCINTTAATTTNGFAAIKFTALADPAMLERVTHALNTFRFLFIRILDDANKADPKTAQPLSHSATLSRAAFNRGINKYFDKLNSANTDRLWHALTARTARATVKPYLKTGHFPPPSPVEDEVLAERLSFDDWFHGLSLPQLAWLMQGLTDEYALTQPPSKPYAYTRTYVDFTTGTAAGIAPEDAALPEGVFALDADDANAMLRWYRRTDKIMRVARDRRVRTMVDAEHCYFQPAIDGLVLDMQRLHNVFPSDVASACGLPAQAGLDAPRYPVVWNTYQNYLVDSTHRMRRDLDTAEREGFFWGAKLVRGAYMLLERRLAEEGGFLSPIRATLEDTHAAYDGNICAVIRRIGQSTVNMGGERVKRVEVMAASHNQQTMQLVTQTTLEQLSLHPETRDPEAPLGVSPAALRSCGVFFGQLRGMADHITFTLGRLSFAPYKYVPYGEVTEVLPYLIRRAQENSDMLGGVTHERKLIRDELKRRMRALIK